MKLVFLIGLLSLSVMHWITIKRSEYLISESHGNMLTHFKIFIFYLLINVFEIFLLRNLLDIIRTSKKNQNQIVSLFAFEFLILFMKGIYPFLKYTVELIEMITISRFENKYALYNVLDFIFTILKLILQLLFINYIRINYGFPLHLLGEFTDTIFMLVTTIKNFINALTLTNKLNKLEDVTERDMVNLDSTCVICFHEMKKGKRISCGHIYHLSCLRTWIQGQVNQLCPKCKAPIRVDLNMNKQREEENRNFPHRSDFNTTKKKMEKKIEKILLQKSYCELKLLDSSKFIKSIKNITNGPDQINMFQNARKNRKNNSYLLENMDLNIDINNIGCVAYGLPRKAITQRNLETEYTRKQINLMINLWIDFLQSISDNTNLAENIILEFLNKEENVKKNEEDDEKEEEKQQKNQKNKQETEIKSEKPEEKENLDELDLRRKTISEAFEKRLSENK